MHKNYTVKKGDEFSFNVTFKNLNTPPDDIMFGLKVDYANTAYDYLITLSEGSILKITDYKYTVKIPATVTETLPFENYNFDLRFKVGTTIKTPFYGRITITPTVFDKD